MRWCVIRGSVAMAVVLAPLAAGEGLLLPARPAAAAAACVSPRPLGYTFDESTDGFTAPSWMTSNDGEPAQSTARVSQGSHSLALPVRFTAGGFDQAGVDKVFENHAPIDLSGYSAVQFDVYAPMPGLTSDFVFNDPWNQPVGMRDLSVGWNTVTYDLGSNSADFPGESFSDIKEIVLRVVGHGVTYSGPIYFDDVRFIVSTNPVIRVRAPQRDATVSIPAGQTYAVSAQACPSAGRAINSVRYQTQRQSGALFYDASSGLWTAPWDLWREGDGLRTLTLSATDSAGGMTSTGLKILVQNSGLRVHLLKPRFDQVLRGVETVTVSVAFDTRFGPPGVQLEAGDQRLPMQLTPQADGTYLATARLDTCRLPDGVHSVRVVARDSRFTVSDVAAVQVQNRPAHWDVVGVRGSSFAAAGRPFRFVGWNEYDLFARKDQTIDHLQLTGDGTVLQKGAVRTWQEQVDRQMLEAERRHLDVLRSWAFDESKESAAFQPAPGQYNEAAFQKLDYIVASARAHGIRVILTLANYWPDYGGIGKYASWLGLPNKLLFFTDPRARDLYRQYVAHLANRVNTVTGTAYKDDPTIFAWELMNQPRSDCADDPTPDHKYCDLSGAAVRSWVSTMAAYIKQLDSRHMVASGGEGHGFVQTGQGGQGIQFARTNEGVGNVPYLIQDVPHVDFFTYHPYPNAPWAHFTATQTRDLVRALTQIAVGMGKPAVMEEYGMDRQQPVYDLSGRLVQPTDQSFDSVRAQWYQFMLDEVYNNGGAGTNVWMLADWHDNNYNICFYLPQPDVARDVPIANLLAQKALQVGSGTATSAKNLSE